MSSGTQANSNVPRVFSRKGGDPDSPVMDIGIFFRVIYNNNNVKFYFGKLKESSQLVNVRNKSYEARFGMEGGHSKHV